MSHARTNIVPLHCMARRVVSFIQSIATLPRNNNIGSSCRCPVYYGNYVPVMTNWRKCKELLVIIVALWYSYNL